MRAVKYWSMAICAGFSTLAACLLAGCGDGSPREAGAKAREVWDKTKEKSSEVMEVGKQHAQEFKEGWDSREEQTEAEE